jgi:hypothetical protein
MSLLICIPEYIYEVGLAQRLGINLFGAAEVVHGPVTDAIKSDARTKVVVKKWWCTIKHCSHPTEDLGWADCVICYTGELINGPWEWYYNKTVKQFNNSNFISVSNGRHWLVQYPKHVVYDDLGHFFSRIVDVCRYEDWNTVPTKPKLFDALLGIAKTHRVFIFNHLRTNGLLDKSFVNIHGSVNYVSPDLHDFDDPVITTEDRKSSMSKVPGLANGIGVSHSIPLGIYQNSWYSIVAETNPANSNFLTEKTAKPLFEKKLFVLFGSQGLLARLHRQGYKTFSSIIDESYDQEPVDRKRWGMAFEQVVKLSTQDHAAVYRQIEPTLEHNHKHICDQHYRLNGLKSFLQQHLLILDREKQYAI